MSTCRGTRSSRSRKSYSITQEMRAATTAAAGPCLTHGINTVTYRSAGLRRTSAATRSGICLGGSPVAVVVVVVMVMAVAKPSAVAAALAEEAALRGNELGANVRHAAKISEIRRRATSFA